MNRQISFSAPFDPYTDIFPVDQNYQKILFKSGSNVTQAHINLLQSILQEQVARFGQHIFVNGSFVTGGQYTQVRDASILDIVSFTTSDLSELKQSGVGDWILETNNQVFSVLSIDTEKEKTPEVHKLLVSKETPIDIVSGTHYFIHSVANPDIKLTVKKAAEFQYIAFDEGVMFVNGYFIHIPKQYTAIRYASSSVGFLLEQNIVSYFDDPSLLDNSSKGFESLGGADRLQLNLELASFSIPKIKTNYSIARSSFFEFLRLDNWEVIKDLTKTQYSKNFSQMLERRTYDKSGSYTVDPFKILVKEGSESSFNIEISPGKAYIFGHEFDSISKTVIPLVKDSGTLANQNNSVTVPNLPYLICESLDRFVPISTDVSVTFFNEAESIGTGTIGYIKKVNDKTRLYLSSFSLISPYKLSDIKTVKNLANLSIASISSVVANIPISRQVSLDPTEKVESILKLEGVSIQRVFENVSNNIVVFSDNEIPPLEVENYIAFTATDELAIIDYVERYDSTLSISSADSIDKVIVSGVLRTITNTIPQTIDITRLLPFSNTINLNYKVNKVISATNNNENITSLFEITENTTATNLIGTTLTYIGTTARTGNVLLKLNTTTFTESTIRTTGSLLDLRQSSYFTFPLLEPNSTFSLYYDTKQARFDKLVLTRDGEFTLIQGTPHPYKPVAPKDRLDAMTLYTLYIPGNPKSPEDIGIKYIENQRYTMRDIGKLEKRIENLEYYNLLSLLEKDTSDQNYKDGSGLDRFKNGFMVDNFKTYKGVDFNSSDCLFSLDLKQGHLRPSFEMENVSLETSVTVPLLSCRYTETILIDQNQASSTLNLNPYEVFTWEGQVVLDPQVDCWVDTTVKPDISLDHTGEFDVYASFKDKGFTSEWGVWDSKILDLASSDTAGREPQNFADSTAPTEKKLWIPDIDPAATPDLIAKYTLWVSSNFTAGFSNSAPDGYIEGKPAILLDSKGQKVQKSAELTHFGNSKVLTNSLGSTVRDVGFCPYIRAKDISFSAKGLKPETQFFVTFSDVEVTALCSGSLTSDSNGDLSGIFSLPAGRFKNGQHQFKLIDTLSKNSSQITSFAVTEYTANGMTSTVQETFISTREPQTTTESVSFTEVSTVFDSSVLVSQHTITINQIGDGLVELYESSGTVPVVTGKSGSPVYFTSETGKNYLVQITETTRKVEKITGVDYIDTTQTRGIRRGSFLFDGDRVIEVKFRPLLEKIPVQVSLFNFKTDITDSEISPYYKVTLSRFPNYLDEITYLQYRKPLTNLEYSTDIVFPLSKDQVSTDILEVTEGDTISVEFITTGTTEDNTAVWVNVESTEIKNQLIKWNDYGSDVVRKTFTQADLDAVTNKNSTQTMSLFYDKGTFLSVRSKTNGESFRVLIECFTDKDHLTSALHSYVLTPKSSTEYELNKMFTEVKSGHPSNYLLIYLDQDAKDVTTLVPYYLDSSNKYIALSVDNLDEGYGIDISAVALAGLSRDVFLDFTLSDIFPEQLNTGTLSQTTPVPTNLISLLDDSPVSVNLDDYPIDSSKICTMRIKIPDVFANKTDKIDVSGILFINGIDAASIINTGIFTYPLDANTRKADITVMKFDCPFNSRISIELKMDSLKPYNLTLDNDLSSQPFMMDVIRAYRYPTLSRKGTFLVNQRNTELSLNIYPVSRMTCIPSQAKKTDLVQVPMVISYWDFLNQTIKINGVDLESIIRDPEKSPFAFRTLKLFIGNRNYVEDLRDATGYSYPGTNREVTISPTPYVVGSSNKKVFIIWYVPINSTFTITSPYNPLEPAFITSPSRTVSRSPTFLGPYVCSYYDYIRTPGKISQELQSYSFNFYRVSDQSNFSGIYSLEPSERKSEYLITNSRGFVFDFNSKNSATQQDFSQFKSDTQTSSYRIARLSRTTSSTPLDNSNLYQVFFVPSRSLDGPGQGTLYASEIPFYSDWFSLNKYRLINSNLIPDAVRGVMDYMADVDHLKTYLKRFYEINPSGSIVCGYYKVIFIKDPDYTGSVRYHLKHYKVDLPTAKDGTLIESTAISSSYRNYIQSNGFVPAGTSTTPTTAPSVWATTTSKTTTTPTMSDTVVNGSTKLINGDSYTYINGAWLQSYSGYIPPNDTSISSDNAVILSSDDIKAIYSLFYAKGTPYNRQIVTYKGRSYQWTFINYLNSVFLLVPTSQTGTTVSYEILYVPKLTLKGKSNSFNISYYQLDQFTRVLDPNFIADGNGTFYTSDNVIFNHYLELLNAKRLSLNYQLVVVEKAVPNNNYFIKEIVNSSTSVSSVTATAFTYPDKTNLQGFRLLTSGSTTTPKVCLTDPLAQSFFIDSAIYPEGVILSSIDLFFRKKDSSQPVMLELRPSVNGYPSSKEIIPFSRVFKPAIEVTPSEDASIPTNFKFEGLVYLKPGEYHFVVISKSLNYDVWVGRLGEFILGDTAKGRITKNPYSGVLFKSSNNTAWLPDSDADFTFRVNRCKFEIGETVFQFSSNTYSSTARIATPLDITSVKPAFSTLVPEGTRISKSLVELRNKESTIAKEFSIPLNDNFDLDGVYTISDTKFDSDSMIEHTVGLYTNKDNVSPLIDWQKSSYVLVNNLINTIGNSDVSELRSYGGDAKARYITKPMKLNLEIPANNLRLEFAANTPAGTQVKVFYRIFNTLHDNTNLTIVDKNWIYLGSATKIAKDKDSFIDFAFESPNPITYPGITNLFEFDVCQVKLVLDSSNPAHIPRVKDFRLIALSS